MKQILFAVGVAAICSAGVFAADDNVRVKITGCVLDGDNGSFILKNVTEMSDGKMSPTSSIYWLSSTKGLKAHVGHKVEVTGTFSPSRDEGKTGKIKTDSGTGQETIKVENGAKKAEASDTAVSGTTGVKTELTKPYRRLEVKSLTMIAPSCQ